MAGTTKSDKNEGSDSQRGYYIYGIVPSDVDLTSEVTGVGDPPATVSLVRQGDIAALVSEISVDRPLGTPEDLMAHEDVLDTAAAGVPVLPLRFGAVMTDTNSVSEELLAPHAEEFMSALRELEGHAEFVIKGRYVQEAIIREVLEEDQEARSLREGIRGKSEVETHDQRLRLGEIIGNAIAAKREQDTQDVVERLTPYCKSVSVRDPTHEEDAVYVAVLVETDRQQKLEDAVNELQGDWSGRVTLRILGPMAPYDFVVTRQG